MKDWLEGLFVPTQVELRHADQTEFKVISVLLGNHAQLVKISRGVWALCFLAATALIVFTSR